MGRASQRPIKRHLRRILNSLASDRHLEADLGLQLDGGAIVDPVMAAIGTSLLSRCRESGHRLTYEPLLRASADAPTTDLTRRCLFRFQILASGPDGKTSFRLCPAESTCPYDLRHFVNQSGHHGAHLINLVWCAGCLYALMEFFKHGDVHSALPPLALWKVGPRAST